MPITVILRDAMSIEMASIPGTRTHNNQTYVQTSESSLMYTESQTEMVDASIEIRDDCSYRQPRRRPSWPSACPCCHAGPASPQFSAAEQHVKQRVKVGNV